jgi:hypothetical protein
MTLDERLAKFMKENIGKRTKSQLAHELFAIYLVARANCPINSLPDGSDPWPKNLSLADVIDYYVLRPLHDRLEEIDDE